MRHAIVIIAGLYALAAAAHADTKAPDLSPQSCGLATPYDVRVDDAGVWLHRAGGSPGEIFIHDGALSVDRQPQAIGEADAVRLREMEREARDLMPQAAGLARDSVDLTFSALAMAIRAISGSERKAHRIERYRDQAVEDIQASLGKGRWDQRAFAETFEADVTQAAEEAAHGLGRSALWAILTGRAHQLDDRAERVDHEVDQLVEARSAVLQRRAQALCTRIAKLRHLQDALDYRYAGAPLLMIEPSPASDGTPPDAPALAAHDEPR